jgi:hypothetical protein
MRVKPEPPPVEALDEVRELLHSLALLSVVTEHRAARLRRRLHMLIELHCFTAEELATQLDIPEATLEALVTEDPHPAERLGISQESLQHLLRDDA